MTQIDLLRDKDEFIKAISDKSMASSVLLGNGFSISFSESFHYGNLILKIEECVELSGDSVLIDLWQECRADDLEVILENIEQKKTSVESESTAVGSEVTSEHTVISTTATTINVTDIEVYDQIYLRLQNIIIETLSNIHPDGAHTISHEEYDSCIEFLSHFKNGIYTLNYDLLSYWVVMEMVSRRIELGDGFHCRHEDEPAYAGRVYSTKIPFVFLHGGLHLYECERCGAHKHTSVENVPIIDLVKNGIYKKQYPLTVLEGSSDRKVSKIQNNSYLNSALSSFSHISGRLITFGWSCGEQDKHIMNLICSNLNLEEVYIGIYDEKREVEIVDRIRSTLAEAGRESVRVIGFSTASLNVWESFAI